MITAIILISGAIVALIALLLIATDPIGPPTVIAAERKHVAELEAALAEAIAERDEMRNPSDGKKDLTDDEFVAGWWALAILIIIASVFLVKGVL